MSFQSASFLFFFLPAVFLLYALLPGIRWKNRLLLLAGLVFYAFGRWQDLPVLLFSAAANYAAGVFIAAGRRKKVVLVLALAVLVSGFEEIKEETNSVSDYRYMKEIQEMAATGKPIIEAMGTKMAMPNWDDILIMGAQLNPPPLEEHAQVDITTVIGKKAKKPMS